MRMIMYSFKPSSNKLLKKENGMSWKKIQSTIFVFNLNKPLFYIKKYSFWWKKKLNWIIIELLEMTMSAKMYIIWENKNHLSVNEDDEETCSSMRKKCHYSNKCNQTFIERWENIDLTYFPSFCVYKIKVRSF